MNYSLDNIRRSLGHFLIGKGVKLFSTLVVLFVLARTFSTGEYAVWATFQAMIIVGGAVFSFGIEHVLTRYVPELRQRDDVSSAWGVFLGCAVLRALSLAVVVTCVLIVLPRVLPSFISAGYIELAPIALCMGCLRLTALTMSQGLESFMKQREAQYSLAAANLTRLAGVCIAVSTGNLSLRNVLVIELVAECVAICLLIAGSRSCITSDGARPWSGLSWLLAHIRRVSKFAFSSWLVVLTSVVSSFGNVRLIAASSLGTVDIARFGFADSLSQTARRVAPVRLLIGMIRPVIFARHITAGGAEGRQRMTNIALKLTAIGVSLVFTLLMCAGEPLFGFLTADKYPMAGQIVAVMALIVLVESARQLLELLAQAAERNSITIKANIVASLVVLVSATLVTTVGIWALVFGMLAAHVIAAAVQYRLIRAVKIFPAFDFRALARIGAATCVATMAGLAADKLWTDFFVTVLVVVGSWIIAILISNPFSVDERSSIRKLLRPVPSAPDSNEVVTP